MTAPSTSSPDGVTIGRGALRQLHQSLARDAGDHAVAILQETGFAAGEGLYRAFSAWVAAHTTVTDPQQLDAARLGEVLSAFFRETGWGSVTVQAQGDAVLTIDSADWAEAEPGSAQAPMCFFTTGMLADFMGRLAGEPVAVMEVECRSDGAPRCRFLTASPDTLNLVYERLTQGQSYAEAIGG